MVGNLQTRKSVPKFARPENWSDPLDLASNQPRRSLAGTSNIRLLSRAPSKREDILSCTLTVFSLEWAPLRRHFNALSYAWRENAHIPGHDGKRILFCNGCATVISQTLHDALVQIWAREPDDLLWVDSLCINQDDIAERNSQVNMMSRIYGEAGKVIVWLGSILSEHIDAMPLVWQAIPIGKDFEARKTTISAKDFLEGDSPEEQGPFWGAFDNLTARAWFSRAWTFQEIMLAGHAEVYCGHLVTSWRDFVLGINWIGTCCMPAVWFRFDFSRLSIRKALCRAGAVPLSQLLVDIQSRSASDAKDKVNAVLAMSFSAGLRADYSLSIEETFISATRHCINLEKSLGLLEIAGLDTRQVPEWGENRFRDPPGMVPFAQNYHEDLLDVLPSWVPDFGTPNFNRHQILELDDFSTNMLGSTAAIIGRPLDRSQLVLRGCVIGRVSITDSQKMLRLLPPCFPPPTTSCPLKELLWDNVQHELMAVPVVFATLSVHDQGMCRCVVPSETFLPLTIAGPQSIEFVSVEDNDFLCVLLGARVPFVLRPVDAETSASNQSSSGVTRSFRIACAATEEPKSMKKWLKQGNFEDCLRCAWLDFRLI